MSHRTKLIAFDLDGTLAPSKGRVPEGIVRALRGLYDAGYGIAIVSGCSWKQMADQVAGHVPHGTWLMPTCGGQTIRKIGDEFVERARHPMSPLDRGTSVHALQSIVLEFNLAPLDPDDILIEDREFQVTLSALGQRAPEHAKAEWGRDVSLRTRILREVLVHLPNHLDARMGGLTSIDITPRGRDKGSALMLLCDLAGVGHDDVTFVGDKLGPGGNDEPASLAGFRCISTDGPGTTEDIINEIIFGALPSCGTI